jgi:phosphatidylserine/phosphatidylglycerophosphate/cardiolipin synthase-like enzyme
VTPIIQPGRNAWRQVHAEDAGLLVDAADYYHAVYWAARSARRYVLMSGWQFDSGVPLLRGADAPPGAEVRLLKFLDGLCRQRPDLRVYLLAWDFHIVLAGEREWLQRVLFHWMTSSNFHFRFDDHPAGGGSHHQKFVVVDGGLAFLGGMDVCEARWDDRRHLAHNPLRTSRGRPQKPYHDVQAWFTGRDAVSAVEELFCERWGRAGGPPLELGPARQPDLTLRGSVPIGPGAIALSRTDPRPDGPAVREVERLFEDAIDLARRLIYIETQYFSSRRIREALMRRMRARDGAAVQIVMLVNERAEALKEEVAVGLRQAQNLEILRGVAAETGCALGCYFTRCDGMSDVFRATYIHSKVLVVDDRFLTVGSANLTNRSLGLDSELHASWEAEGDASPLVDAIRGVRVSLLAEATGLADVDAGAVLGPIEGLVDRLDALAGRPGARLQRHGAPSTAQQVVMQVVDPEDLPFDAETFEADDRTGRSEPADEHRPRGLLVRLAGPLAATGALALAGVLAHRTWRHRRRRT